MRVREQLAPRPPDGENTRAPATVRRGAARGIAAGLVAIGCCVGPVVAALLGLMSAAAAADLANDLYADWGWAFKVAGAVFGGAALLAARRHARACRLEDRSIIPFALVLVATGTVTYLVLYAATTSLGRAAT